MADSIHDQWPTATADWPNAAAMFAAAWVGIYQVYDVNSDYAWLCAGINYLARLFMDESVMAGDMITHIAQTGVDSTTGLVNNFQNLQDNVLPAWGRLAADYAETRAQAWAAHEALNREAADTAEAAARAAGDLQLSNAIAAGIAAEAATRAAGDAALLAALNSLLAAEAAARAAGDAASRQQAQAGDAAVTAAYTAAIAQVLAYAQSIPSTIDARAAAGYDPTLAARGTLLQRLLDTAVAHDPTVAALVSDLAKYLIDLAGVEDPVLRVAAQVVLKQVIDRLGLDSALHQILGDLLGEILGGGQPKTLTAIMGDIGGRLTALESSVASLSPLAGEADDLHTMGGLVFDAALLAYTAGAVADPVAAANDTATVLEAVTGPLLAPVRALLGM